MFSVIVRTYKRPDEFVSRSYTLLSKQIGFDIAKQLYIFVGNKQEKARYEKALGDRPYKEIVIGRVGLKEVTDCVLDYFGDGKELFFLDDDIRSFFSFTGHPLKSKINKDSKRMVNYLIDAFQTLRNEKISTFTFRNMQNALFASGGPFKEIRPFYMCGGAWGGISNKKLFSTTFSHSEDYERTAKVIEAEGGTLLYNWAGFVTHKGNIGQGTNDGGMQASGDRGDPRTRREVTRLVTESLYLKEEIQKYLVPPYYNEDILAYDFKLKPLRLLRKFKIVEKKFDL